MTLGFYPGSFNPWHTGHYDILDKALRVFDRVVIGIGQNPEKPKRPSDIDWFREIEARHEDRVGLYIFKGLQATAVDEWEWDHPEESFTAVVRGLRNGMDLQFETNQQYWNEDLGLKIPTVFFITDRKLSHISSSDIRALKKLR